MVEGVLHICLEGGISLVPMLCRRPSHGGESLRRISEQVSGDDHALDLACAFVDLEDLCVAHQLLHGVPASM